MYVDLELDKPRRLRYDLRAIRDLETRTGKPLGTLVNELRLMSATTILDCLWAGLKHEDPALTPNLVLTILESYLDGHSIVVVMTAIDEALNQSGLLRRAAEDREGNAHPEAAAT